MRRARRPRRVRPGRREHDRPPLGDHVQPRGLPAERLVRLDEARAVGERHGRARAGERQRWRRTSASRPPTRSRSARTPPTRSPTATATRRTRSTRRRSPTARACCSREEYYAGPRPVGLLPRAAGVARLRPRHARLQRRPARQPDRRCACSSATRTSCARRCRSALGIDGASISLGGTEQLSAGQLHAVDIDISTSAGWQAYQDFLAIGRRCPRTGRRARRTRRLRGRQLLRRDERRGRARPDHGRRPRSAPPRAAGSRPRTPTGTSRPSVHLALQQRRPRHPGVARRRRGPDRRPEYALTCIGADELAARERCSTLDGDERQRSARRRQRAGSTSTTATSRTLRELALGDLPTRSPLNGGDPSAEDIAASLEDGDGVVEYDGVEYAFDPGSPGSRRRQTPEEILVALYTSAPPRPGGLLQQLGDLLRNQDAELPGELAAPDCD